MSDFSREDQESLGSKIAKLTEKKVGSFFSWNTKQGGGVVAKLIFTAAKITVITQIKNYLQRELGLSYQNDKDTSKNHGSGAKFTLLVNLSEIRKDGRTRVENAYSIIFKDENLSPKSISNKKEDLLRKVISEEIKDTNTYKNLISKPAIIGTSSGMEDITALEEKSKSKVKPESKKMSLSQFLSSFLFFEVGLYGYSSLLNDPIPKSLFHYDKKMKGEHTIIHCLNEKIAAQVLSSLIWFTGDMEFVDRESKDVMINLSYTKSLDKKPYGVHFCLPPTKTDTWVEVEKRLLRVKDGTYPKLVSCAADGSSFTVSYHKKDTVRKIYDFLIQMGWMVHFDRDNNFLVIFTSSSTVPDLVRAEIIVPEKEIVSEVVIPVMEAVEEFVSQTSKIEERTLSLVEEKAQALKEFEEAFNNKELFVTLSFELQREIVSVLEANWKEMHKEEYLKQLMNKFFK
jgi:hypothetical protein